MSLRVGGKRVWSRIMMLLYGPLQTELCRVKTSQKHWIFQQGSPRLEEENRLAHYAKSCLYKEEIPGVLLSRATIHQNWGSLAWTGLDYTGRQSESVWHTSCHQIEGLLLVPDSDTLLLVVNLRPWQVICHSCDLTTWLLWQLEPVTMG